MKPITKFMQKTWQKLFGDQLDFRVRLFNILAVLGIFISLMANIAGIIASTGLASYIATFAMTLIAIAVLWYGNASGKYQLCYMIVIIGIFFILYSALFFNTGGYHSAMPSYFIFAVLFTVFMLKGKKMVVMSVLELTIYAVLCLYAYYNPEKVSFFKTEEDFLTDVLMGLLVVSVTLIVTMSLHLKLYDQRQRELAAARKQVEGYARMKSELFAEMSHEMRTPLTVMSTYAQYAVEKLRKAGTDEQTIADLAKISKEAKRLAEMADGTLKILIKTDPNKVQINQPVDVGAVCLQLVKLLEPIASRKGMKLQAVSKDNIPAILGDADALTQLVWNILQNAITHSEGKSIELAVDASDGVTVTVSDDGVGIEPEKGGVGIGLAICRDIAKLHGGSISIESASGVGTKITVILRGIAKNGGKNA